MLTLAELRILISAVDGMCMEYGREPSAEESALLAKLRAERDSRLAEIESYR